MSQDIIVGQKYARRYEDGGERISVSFDVTRKIFADRVTIRQFDSDDCEIQADFGDIRWLAATLNEIAEVLEAGGHIKPEQPHDHQ